MLTAGELFRVTTDIVAIEFLKEQAGNRMSVVLIPPGSTIQVVKYPRRDDDRMADALWGDKPVAIFGRDLYNRATQIKAMSANAANN